MKPQENLSLLRDHDLTVEEVKACDLFRHLSDEEALEVIETLKILSKIVFDEYQEIRKKR